MRLTESRRMRTPRATDVRHQLSEADAMLGRVGRSTSRKAGDLLSQVGARRGRLRQRQSLADGGGRCGDRTSGRHDRRSPLNSMGLRLPRRQRLRLEEHTG